VSKNKEGCKSGYTPVFQSNAFTCTRICPEGQTYVGGEGGNCVVCPNGTEWDDTLKQCIGCPSDMTLYDNGIGQYTTKCGLTTYSCEKNAYNKNGMCVNCPNGMFVNNARTNCNIDLTSDYIHEFYSDPSYNVHLGLYDHHLRYGSCPDNTINIGKNCYSCPTNTYWNNQLETCVPNTIQCPSGTQWKNGVCMSCPSNTTFNSKSDTCNFI